MPSKFAGQAYLTMPDGQQLYADSQLAIGDGASTEAIRNTARTHATRNLYAILAQIDDWQPVPAQHRKDTVGYQPRYPGSDAATEMIPRVPART